MKSWIGDFPEPFSSVLAYGLVGELETEHIFPSLGMGNSAEPGKVGCAVEFPHSWHRDQYFEYRLIILHLSDIS